MSTIDRLEKHVLHYLMNNHSENPKLETRIFFEQLEKLKEGDKLTKKGEEKFLQMLKVVKNKQPIQYFTGYTYVKGKKILIDHNVLLPGPEIEKLIDLCEDFITSKSKVLDLCTGSGVIAVILGSQHKHTKFFAIDISKEALSTAKKNASLHKLKNVQFLKGNLFHPLSEKGLRDFDLIVSNPPYCRSQDIKLLPPQIRDYVPRIAIDGGKDGLRLYKRLIKEAKNYLKKNGYLILETENKQTLSVQRLLEENNFKTIKIEKNHLNQERFVVAKLK